jgi:hypothetical protein
MNTQKKNEEVCRYCKLAGHFKNKCPKLAGRNNNDSAQRNDNHNNYQSRGSNRPNNGQQRTDYNNHDRRQNNYRPRLMGVNQDNKPLVVTEPKVDEFPSLGLKEVKIPVVWGGKSFTDIVNTEPVIKIKKEHDGFVILSSLNN